MPITDSVDSGEPLTQGDILTDTKLFVSGVDGAPHEQHAGLCLVVSRPCQAVRSKVVTVARIEQYPKLPKHMNSFDKIRKTLLDLRDGQHLGSFFLGQLPNHEGRFCARFEPFYALQIPNGADRQGFIDSHRIARLDPNFAKDLHLSVSRSFASLGFDDNSWWTTEDLECLIAQGEADIKLLEAEKAQHESVAVYADAGGVEPPEAKKDHDQLIETLNTKLEPLREELARRTN